MATIGLEIKVPKGWWDEKNVLQELKKTLKKETGKSILKDFKTTTKGWRRQNKKGKKIKPTFKTYFKQGSNEMAVKVSTTDDVYRFVNDGTEARLIFPKKSALRFKPGYSAKTKPGSLSSGKASRTGAFMHATYVRHLGIKPRGFDETILKRQKMPFAIAVNKAIWRGMTD